MSNEELEVMALEMSRKIASELPRSSAVLGVERVVLSSQPSEQEFGIWAEWSRGCFRTDLEREGIIVNPEVVQNVLAEAQSSKRIIKSKSVG